MRKLIHAAVAVALLLEGATAAPAATLNPNTMPYSQAAVITCYRDTPSVCDVFPLDLVRQDGQPLSAMECMMATGQTAVITWMESHPGMFVQKLICAFGTDRNLRDKLLNSMGKAA